MLVGAGGVPIVPDAVAKALAAEHPRYFLRWCAGAVTYWGICERWRDRDPRRERIQSGELNPAMDFDIITKLPRDCSAEEVLSFISNYFERVTDPEKQAQKAVDDVEKHNEAHKESLTEKFLEDQITKTIATTKHDIEVQMGEATANAQITVPSNAPVKANKRKK